jgi:hypothetical protein
LRLKSEPKPWITPRLLEVFKERDLAHEYSNLFRNSPTRDFYTNCFNDAMRHGNRLKRETKRDYLTCALSTNVTPDRFWKLCGSFGIHSKRSDSSVDFEPNEINDHFAASVSNGDILDNSDISSGHLGDGEFTFDEVGQFGIFGALGSISSDACGFDGVSLKFLKLIIEYVIDPLTHLVNCSLSTSCFSKHWKKSVLTPIPKKSEVRGLDDLRPISILPCKGG